MIGTIFHTFFLYMYASEFKDHFTVNRDVWVHKMKNTMNTYAFSLP